jgi:hypothetical protein
VVGDGEGCSAGGTDVGDRVVGTGPGSGGGDLFSTIAAATVDKTRPKTQRPPTQANARCSLAYRRNRRTVRVGEVITEIFSMT